MKLTILMLATVLVFGVLPQTTSNKPVDGTLVFEGTVLKIGHPMPASGFNAFYRLAKYRVERVCRGKYTKSEIVVDHLSLTTKELNAIKVGDRVRVTVVSSKKIFTRFDEEGIREKSDKVKVFYVGGEVPPPGRLVNAPQNERSQLLGDTHSNKRLQLMAR